MNDDWIKNLLRELDPQQFLHCCTATSDHNPPAAQDHEIKSYYKPAFGA